MSNFSHRSCFSSGYIGYTGHTGYIGYIGYTCFSSGAFLGEPRGSAEGEGGRGANPPAARDFWVLAASPRTFRGEGTAWGDCAWVITWAWRMSKLSNRKSS